MLLRAAGIILQPITVNHSWDPKTDRIKFFNQNIPLPPVFELDLET